jgi:tetratricopeptide (TPR) repeat protein
MKRFVYAATVCLALLAFTPTPVSAAPEKWYEIKSPHFTVWSNADDGNTRKLVWQLEQIRSVIGSLWPWAKVDLPKPMLVIAPKNEQSMKQLAPQYWEVKDGIRPASLWVGGADQHYLVIRSDVRGNDTERLNPHITAYFSYVNLILQANFNQRIPVWFARGLAGVMSNTLVRDDHILLGSPIPWELERLREHQRMSLKQLVGITRDSPQYKQQDGIADIDARSWAFVHFLMFADKGAHRPRVNQLADLLGKGVEPAAAISEALGSVEDFETPLHHYVQRSLFMMLKTQVDASVPRDRFAARLLDRAESAAGRALFHVAMRRPAEARILVEEARKADPTISGAYVAEAVQFDMAGDRSQAKAAYAKAAELGTSSAYALYRSAVSNWPKPDDATLRQMEANLSKAITLNPSFAAAYASLGEVRAALKQPAPSIMPQLAKAISLEPSSPWHRLAAARVLWMLGSMDEARKTAEAALAIAVDDDARAEVTRLLAQMSKG